MLPCGHHLVYYIWQQRRNSRLNYHKVEILKYSMQKMQECSPPICKMKIFFNSILITFYITMFLFGSALFVWVCIWVCKREVQRNPSGSSSWLWPGRRDMAVCLPAMGWALVAKSCGFPGKCMNSEGIPGGGLLITSRPAQSELVFHHLRPTGHS